MPEWSEFGDQVNRLVYTLAGRKFQADIESTNRFVAEQILYSEVSVRMMRQGRFRPREEKALEILVEIGCTQAELSREWASRLLYSGRHPHPQRVLDRVYSLNSVATVIVPPAATTILTVATRLVGGVLGSLLALLIWTYVISPVYPAPHELPLWMEGVWGLLIGAGLAGGVLCADIITEKGDLTMLKAAWPRYMLLPAGGVLGALLWHLAAANLFFPSVEGVIRSTWLETFCFGAVYGLAFAASIISASRLVPGMISHPWQFVFFLFLTLMMGGFALLGFLLAKAQPSFANQKDVDLFVGIFLRAGLILAVSVLFPALRASRRHNQNVIPNPFLEISKT